MSGRSSSATFSPDGKRVITAGKDGRVKIWDTVLGVETYELEGRRRHASLVGPSSRPTDTNDRGRHGTGS